MADPVSDTELRRILRDTKTIVALGVSPNPVRPSHFVARYLSMRGYRVIPINPGHAGKELFGETILGSLADVPADIEVDMLDVFRRSEFVPDIYRDACAHLPTLKTLWLQVGIQHDETAAKARADGCTVIQDRCPKIESQRLFGELRNAGFNTGVISSRLPDW